MSVQAKSTWVRSIRSLGLWLGLIAMLVLGALTPAAAQTTTQVKLNVVSAVTPAGGTPDPVYLYKFIVNLDNAGTTTQRSPALGTGCNSEDPGYPDTCFWTSIAGAKSTSPVILHGTQNDVDGFSAGVPLADGRYLVSVLADGIEATMYKLDGQHFTVANGQVLVDGIPVAGNTVTVRMQPIGTGLPDAQIQAAVFEDISPVNSAPDLPAEHGLAGFQGHITDYLGEVTTNVYGDALCTRYDATGNAIPGTGGRCLSACYVVNGGVDVGHVRPLDVVTGAERTDLFSHGRCPADGTGRTMYDWTGASLGPVPAGAAIEGKIKIPNLGPNRYALSVTPPDGSSWIQTTTLEGNHDWDAWVMEGATGLDTEFVVAGEPFPAIIFGYIPGSLNNIPAGGTATIKGVVDAVKIYVPTNGGIGGLPGQIWGGLQGAKIDKPIANPWVTLTNLGNGDTVIWAGKGGADGKFEIPNVPPGNYTLTWWDEPQNTILDLVNVTVSTTDSVIDMGVLPLTGWWTFFDGYVFDDQNRNGIKDPGEPGLPGYTLTMRKRENSLMDRGTTATTTDATGYYRFEAAYPMTQWLVMEAYDDLHYTTGITYQADNQPTPTTVIGAGVDVSVHPIIGLSGRMDWGKHTYDATGANGVDPMNGGIVGTVSYDTTRNETDPRYAAVEDWQPSIPDLTVKLFATVPCTAGGPCDPTNRFAVDADGAFRKGPLLNTYLTETWQRPTGCVARGVDGEPIPHGTGEQVLSPDGGCIEAPLTGIQFAPYATGQGTPDANFGAAVDGNYGFGDGCFTSVTPRGGTPGLFDEATGSCTTGSLMPLPGGNYLVQVEIPTDALGRRTYKVTREEDINIGNGDTFKPAVAPSECAGPLHTVDVAGVGTDGYPALTLANGVVIPASSPVDNPTWAELGGSPYEGQARPDCGTKLVTLTNGRSIAPAFNLYTDVPIPGRHWFIIIDDLNFSTNPQSTTLGEKAGMPFVPIGIYDYTDRLITTIESDYNGLADVLLPSTNRINCPTPSGVCANLYRYVGNDPGVPGRLNLNYNPTYRTIAAEFEVLPGLLVPADLAPTQVGVTVQLPGSQTTSPVMCMLGDDQPKLYAVNDPVITSTQRNLVIEGAGFGTAGTLTLGGATLTPTSWSDSHIAVTVPATQPDGPQQLMITRADNGQGTVNGLTIHVLADAAGAPTLSTLTFRDNFNRTSSSTLGGNWSQAVLFGNAAIRVNNNQAFALLSGSAFWNGAGSSAGPTQGAAFTFANVVANSGVVLKASAGTLPGSYISVVFDGSQVAVRTTTTAGLGQRVQGTVPGTFASGDTLTAAADNQGVVYVWKNAAYLGSVTLVSSGANAGTFITGGGRFGMLLATGARADNFSGGTATLTPGGSGGYNPMVYAVGPGRTYAPAETLPQAADHAIQRALDTAATFVAASNANANRGALVVVYPNNPSANPRQNPRGAYYENLLITSRVKLQGVGPGSPSGAVRGSIIDGGAFAGDSPVATDWYTRIGLETAPDAAGNAVPTWGGNATIYDGAAISLYLPVPSAGACNAAACRKAFPVAYAANTAPSIDGFDIRGGDQQGFPGNINQIGGGATGLPPGQITQGGAIFANAYARNLQVTNNVVQNNGGAYGSIRIGSPDLPDPNNENDGVVIAHNRVISNAGTNLAGGIGLFSGADGYQVVGNDICGNFSSEYGGGISHVGLSPNGKIHDNRIYFNRSFDEGGGIMIAGALPANTTTLSPGAGPVDIYNNVIQANLANDDGGGIRFLMAGNFPMNVYNNFIVNNVSTHEGGGIALNDAPDVRVYNNTIMKNLTTATAVTSNGAPAPAGLSTSLNSTLLQATLPAGSPVFSNPLLFNNIFWDNRAGTRTLTGVTGLGDPNVDVWDLGTADGSGTLAPTNSVIQQNAVAHDGYVASATNSAADPGVIQPIDIPVTFNTWRNNPAFLGAILISADLPPNLLSNYHLGAGSPAANLGAASKGSIVAPAFDVDNQARPAGGAFDAGADEIGASTTPPPTTASVAFTAASAGTLSSSGDTLALGSVAGAYNPITITLTVSGAPATIGNVVVAGDRFSELGGGTCQGKVVPAGATCTVVVNFNGNGNTPRTGQVSVPYGGAGPATLQLTGH
jgi:hypothetical protein